MVESQLRAHIKQVVSLNAINLRKKRTSIGWVKNFFHAPAESVNQR